MVYCLRLNLIIRLISNDQGDAFSAYYTLYSDHGETSLPCLLITDLTVVLHVCEVAVSLALAAEAVHVGRREDGV